MKLKPESASAAIIIDKNNNFLMQKRDKNKNIFFPGHWGLFGGAKNKNERYITTLKREIKEEIGFIPNKIEHFINLTFNLKKLKKKEIQRYFYVCTVDNIYKKEIKLTEGEKYGIFSLKKLKRELNSNNLFVPYDQLALWFYIYRNKF